MRDFLSKRVVSLEPSGIRKFFDIVSEMPDAISLGVGEPDFDTPWRVREEGIYSLERGRTFYTSNAGLKELRYEISEYLERKYELVYDPNHEITVTVGGSEGIDIAMRTILDPGDEVIVVQPCFVSYVACVVMAGGTPVIVSLKEEDKFKLKKEQLEAAVTDKTKAMIISFPNNPTGAIMTKEELEPIAEFAKEHGFTAQSLNEKYADILKDITSHSKDAVQSTIADKGLQKLINTVNDLNSEDYTADSWKALQSALAEADTALKEKKDQDTVDKATEKLNKAISALVKKDAGQKVNGTNGTTGTSGKSGKTGSTSNTKSGKAAKTGDPSGMFAWLGLAVTSLGAGIGGFSLKRRKREDEE